MAMQEVRVEVTPLQTEGMRDVLGDVVQRQLFAITTSTLERFGAFAVI